MEDVKKFGAFSVYRVLQQSNSPLNFMHVVFFSLRHKAHLDSSF